MEYLCEFAIMNADYDIDDMIGTQCFSYDDFNDLSECVKIICEKLGIEEKDIDVKPENINMQRATVISFKFKDRLCELYEHFDTQRDYLGIRMMSVS